MTYLFIKRVFDITLSLFIIILLIPILLFVAASVYLDSGLPIIYKGKRAGLNNSPFYIFKFRTMIPTADSIGGFSTSLNDCRLTRIGGFLRKYKLDELPQFFNVFFGDMSFVGPRPQVFFYTDQYVDVQKIILTTRPGITDLASIYFLDMDKILGEGDVSTKYQIEIEPIKNILRVKYVQKRSFIFDLRIIIETAFSLIGISNITNLNIEKMVLNETV